MNTNLSTIDNFLKPITVSGSTYTFTGNHVGNQSGGTITATKITNSGTLTQTGTSTFTGKITANGGIGTKALSVTSISNSGTLTQTGTSTFTGKITANGGVNDYEERITALEAGEFESITVDNITVTNSFNYQAVIKVTPNSNYTISYSKSVVGCYIDHITVLPYALGYTYSGTINSITFSGGRMSSTIGTSLTIEAYTDSSKSSTNHNSGNNYTIPDGTRCLMFIMNGSSSAINEASTVSLSYSSFTLSAN